MTDKQLPDRIQYTRTYKQPTTGRDRLFVSSQDVYYIVSYATGHCSSCRHMWNKTVLFYSSCAESVRRQRFVTIKQDCTTRPSINIVLYQTVRDMLTLFLGANTFCVKTFANWWLFISTFTATAPKRRVQTRHGRGSSFRNPNQPNPSFLQPNPPTT